MKSHPARKLDRELPDFSNAVHSRKVARERTRVAKGIELVTPGRRRMPADARAVLAARVVRATAPSSAPIGALVGGLGSNGTRLR